MQTLDVISVNLWQILISLLNLLLLFLIFKHFLFKPVRNVLKKRQDELDSKYAKADETQAIADENKAAWEEKLLTADKEADTILEKATENAKYRGDKIIEEAKQQADSIIKVAEAEAMLERRKAKEDIKKEIVEVSGVLAEKMLEREINKDDHRAIIDSVIEEIGEGDD
ncbi:MAG: F0F1 ATP synthase subunit B [Clostridia bacterium]|nr:F0F1 ATP synthase subunit B [Clostridia bacterium]